MDFALPAELIEFQELIRQMARDQIGPRAAEVDETGEYPQDLFEVFRDVGLLGLCIPADHGGSGAGVLGLALALEELARVSVAAALILELPRTSAGPLMLAAGAIELRERYLPAIADGSQRAAVALCERGIDSGVLDIATTAVRDADKWVLSGTKCSVLAAAQADWFVVFAKTSADPASRTRDSVSAFVVDAGLEGLSVGEVDQRVGVRGIDTAELVLADVCVEAQCVIGAVGSGLRLATLVPNVGGPLAAARAVGLAEAALMCAAEHVGGDEVSRREMAQVTVDLEAVRLLALRGAWMIDVGQTDRKWSAQLALSNHAGRVAVRATDLAARVAGSADSAGPAGSAGSAGSASDTERWSRDAHQLCLDAGDPGACLDGIADGVAAHELWWGDLGLG